MKTLNLPLKIGNFLSEMATIEQASPHTLRAYQSDLTQVFSSATSILENRILERIRLVQTQSWSKLSLASRNRKAGAIKSFLGWLFRRGDLEKNLADQIASPKVPQKIPHFLSVDEAIALVKSLERAKADEQPAVVLILLLYGGGLRVSEACGLLWKDVQWSSRTLRVLGKGRKERLVECV